MKQLLKLTGCLAVAGLFASCQSAQQEADYQIIPMPQEIVTASGNPFILKSSVKILYPEGNENMQRNAKFLADYLKTATGKDFVIEAGTEGENAIVLALGTESENPESYQLKVTGDGITITAPTEAGVFYGIQSLRKSLPVAIGAEIALPAVEIKDAPRFAYRGAHFDTSRHFFTVDEVKTYIDMNFDGLREDVLSMMAGESVPVNTGSFINDMATFRTEDDVLTLLIHLGYLAYDYENKTVRIPNNEIRGEYVNSVAVSEWGEVSTALKNSADTLNAIWQKRPLQVAEGIRQAHFETAHIQYNDENALSYTISLALYAARNFYTVHRELAGGKGFADLVFVPRKKFQEKPALIVELKWDKSVRGAIEQIRQKEYFESLKEYQGNMLLVGINYNIRTKDHECVIEELKKDK